VICEHCTKEIPHAGLKSWIRVLVASPTGDPPEQEYLICSTACLAAYAAVITAGMAQVARETGLVVGQV
jgi:hypothetical protein